jgi:hypothetical protein
MRLSSARGLQDAAPLFDETGRAVRRPGPPGNVSADGQVARFAPAGCLAAGHGVSAGQWRFPVIRASPDRVLPVPSFSRRRRSVDGEAGFPDSGGQRAGAGFINGILPDLSAAMSEHVRCGRMLRPIARFHRSRSLRTVQRHPYTIHADGIWMEIRCLRVSKT